MGQLHKYAIQLAFPQEGCASGIAECEGLLASLSIAARMGISHLSIQGDSQLTASHAEGVELSPLMKVYAGEVRKLECHFHSLKLEHVPHRQDAAVKEFPQIAAKGLPVLAGVIVENDEDIPSIDTTAVPTAEHIQGPIT
jgi:ribonuclease HI